MEPIILGIDPGATGGMAFVSLGLDHVWTYSFSHMTEQEIFDAITEAKGVVIEAWLEKVGPSGHDSRSSTFKFGMRFGHVEMAVLGNHIRLHKVRPAVWQKSQKCLSGGDKKVTRARAQELFPDVKVTHAIADALLIADYGRRYYLHDTADPMGALG